MYFSSFPNVAEDHQTKNANVLVNAGAAVCVADKDTKDKLEGAIFEVLKDGKQKTMSENLKKLAIPDASKRIVNEIKEIIINNEHSS